MKRWAPNFILSLILVLTCAVNVFAQDAGMSDTEMVTEAAEGEKLILVPGEMDARYIPRASGVYAPSDSIALHAADFPMRQAVQKPAERSGEKQNAKPKDDSILTYNFLYYIIQKYKLQDIID